MQRHRPQPSTPVKQDKPLQDTIDPEQALKQELQELVSDARMYADALKAVVPKAATTLENASAPTTSQPSAGQQTTFDRTKALLTTRWETRHGDRSVAMAMAYTGFLYAVIRQQGGQSDFLTAGEVIGLPQEGHRLDRRHCLYLSPGISQQRQMSPGDDQSPALLRLKLL